MMGVGKAFHLLRQRYDRRPSRRNPRNIIVHIALSLDALSLDCAKLLSRLRVLEYPETRKLARATFVVSRLGRFQAYKFS